MKEDYLTVPQLEVLKLVESQHWSDSQVPSSKQGILDALEIREFIIKDMLGAYSLTEKAQAYLRDHADPFTHPKS